MYPETGPPIITTNSLATPQFNSVTINSAALGITNLLLVFPAANGGFSSGSVQGMLLKANGNANGSYSATWNNVTVNGQTLTFTGLQTSASTMQNNSGTTANITSATLTLTLTPQGPTGGTVSGTMTLTSTLATVSGSFTGTYSAQPGSVESPRLSPFTWRPTATIPGAACSPRPMRPIPTVRLRRSIMPASIVQPISKAGTSQVNVQVRAGTYFLPATETFSAADSGSATTKVVYQNYPGESPVLSGGVRVQNWTNTGGNTWKTTLPASTQYFENLFYNGARRLRPRLGGALGTYYRIANTVYLNAPAPPAAAPNPNCAVFIAGSGWECFDRFQYSTADPISNTWKNLAASTGNPCGQPAGNQAIAGDIEVLVWEQFSTSKLRVSCIDAANRIVYMTGPTGFSQSHASESGFIAGNRYLVENVQDALTLPGQWFVDHSTTPWTLTYLANAGRESELGSRNHSAVTPGAGGSNLQYVTFQGLTFEHDNYVVAPTGHVSVELEPDVSAAVSFQNSQHITFDSGIVTQTSGTGLEVIPCLNTASSPAYCVSTNLNAVVANNLIENSAFYDVGALGIRIGEPFAGVNTDANVAQFTTVENNVVEGYGRAVPASFGIGQGMGHDNLYTHNDVYDGYHCAISTSQSIGATVKPSGIGNANNIISFNHVYNLLQGIMNDGGSIRIDGGNSVFTAAGNKILNNKIHDVTDASIMDSNGYGGNGVYMDDHTGLVDVENNLVYRVSGAAVYTPHGPEAPNEANTIKNNILAFARLSMVSDNGPYDDGVPATAEQAFVVTNNLFYFDRTNNSGPPFRVQGGCSYSAISIYGVPTIQQQPLLAHRWRLLYRIQSVPRAARARPRPECAVFRRQNNLDFLYVLGMATERWRGLTERRAESRVSPTRPIRRTTIHCPSVRLGRDLSCSIRAKPAGRIP